MLFLQSTPEQEVPGTVSRLLASFFLLALMTQHSERRAQQPDAPDARKIPHSIVTHGHERIDPYYWLNDRGNSEVIDYLNRENEYTKAMMADVAELKDDLFEEIVGRIKQDDQTVPYEDRGYEYYIRYETGEQHPIYCRRRSGQTEEEIILNVNELAIDKPFCNVAQVKVSENSQLLAYTVDFQGRRQYAIHFKDLTTGKLLADSINGINGGFEWADDNQTVFYTRNDPQTLRAYLVKRHRLGQPESEDVDVFEEKDEEFACWISKSRSRKFIFIESAQTLSTEFRLLAANDPDGEFQVFQQREQDHEYEIDHVDNTFYIRSNHEAPNFRLFQLSIGEQEFQSGSRDQWEEVVAHRGDTFLEEFDLFDRFVVLTERSNALTRLRVMGRKEGQDYYLPFDEEAYVVESAPTPDPASPRLRYRYTSLTTPTSTFELNMETRESQLLKQQPVLGGFDREQYRTDRLWAQARDGARIPVTVVHRKDTPIDGSAPCLQYAYGSYGSSIDPNFRHTILSLLDRGFVYAIAHIRGGQEMGRSWYEDGKLNRKMNTFTDFIDVGQFLIEQQYSAPDRLYARGGSAGGLLMGAVINMAPQQYHGVIADVPFVDVVTTMLDDSIPLTTFEYDEWGNPNEEDFYRYMLAYSPYDNVADREYPNLLVTTGLHDSQVQYWEPAKWVAKLRDHWQGDNVLLLKTNMEAGHGGASGRFDRYKEVALRYAFLLQLESKAAESGPTK